MVKLSQCEVLVWQYLIATKFPRGKISSDEICNKGNLESQTLKESFARGLFSWSRYVIIFVLHTLVRKHETLHTGVSSVLSSKIAKTTLSNRVIKTASAKTI